MKFKLNEIKGRWADDGRGVSWDDIAAATGISKPTLLAMSKGSIKQVRPEYLDALCAFFGVDIAGLVQSEAVKLPLNLKIRPDRHGVPVGRKGKQ